MIACEHSYDFFSLDQAIKVKESLTLTLADQLHGSFSPGFSFFIHAISES